MKCLECYEPSRVVDDDLDLDGLVVKRTRVCVNHHVFTTYEVNPGCVDWKGVKVRLLSEEKKRRFYEHKVRILRSNESNVKVARKIGLTEAYVRTVRKLFRQRKPPKKKEPT